MSQNPKKCKSYNMEWMKNKHMKYNTMKLLKYIKRNIQKLDMDIINSYDKKILRGKTIEIYDFQKRIYKLINSDQVGGTMTNHYKGYLKYMNKLCFLMHKN